MKENIENLKVQSGENFSGINVTDSDNRGSGLNIKELLLNDASLWRASDIDKRSHNGTGYVNLDNILPGGGWPKKGIVEIINQHYGGGELQLLIDNEIHDIKLKKGWAVTYSTGIPHQVKKVTSGQRYVSVFWTTSRIPDIIDRDFLEFRVFIPIFHSP